MLKFIGFYDYTVILTYMSLVSAVVGMILSSQGAFHWAVLCLLISGICDAFDGIVARSKKNRTDDEKAFGIQIDSLCDVVSFGVSPAMFCYFLCMNDPAGILIVCMYSLCAVIRLAFFNMMEEKRQKTETGIAHYYRGLPVTSISLILPPVYLTQYLLSPGAFDLLLHVTMLLCAFLFILDFPVKKPDWSKLLKRSH